jgi:hypothetical protein
LNEWETEMGFTDEIRMASLKREKKLSMKSPVKSPVKTPVKKKEPFNYIITPEMWDKTYDYLNRTLPKLVEYEKEVNSKEIDLDAEMKLFRAAFEIKLKKEDGKDFSFESTKIRDYPWYYKFLCGGNEIVTVQEHGSDKRYREMLDICDNNKIRSNFY